MRRKKDELIKMCMIFLTFLTFLILPKITHALLIYGVEATPNPIKVSSGYVKIIANITTNYTANESISNVYAIITTPNFKKFYVLPSNSTYTIVNGTNISEFVFYYFPSVLGTYFYNIFVNTTNGSSYLSEQYTFKAIHYPYVDYVKDNTPFKFGEKNVTIYAYIRAWVTDNITNATLEVCPPKNFGSCFNETMQFYAFNGKDYIFNATFEPKVSALWDINKWVRFYQYRIYAYDNTSNATVSHFYPAIVEDFPPSLQDFSVKNAYKIYNVGIQPFRSNITVYINFTINDVTNLTNYTPNINESYAIVQDTFTGKYKIYNLTNIYNYINSTSISNSSINASNTSNTTIALNLENGIVIYNLTFPYLYPHRIYVLKLFFMDTHGNKYLSDPIYISDNLILYKRLNISVKVAPHCCLNPIVVVTPKVLYQGQAYTAYTYVENCGSVPLNISGNVKVYQVHSNIYSYYETLTKDYQYSDLLPGQIAGIYFVRDTSHYSESNYSVVLNVNYYSPICLNKTNSSDWFEVKKFGGHGPSDLIVIREMPPSIMQTPSCENNTETCNYADVRLILYNTGTQNLTNITFTDTIHLNISNFPDPSAALPIKIVCPSTKYFNCSVLTFGYNPYTHLIAEIKVKVYSMLLPRHYIIIPYKIYPSANLSVYNETHETKYSFFVTGTYVNGYGKLENFVEGVSYYNPPESKVMELVNKPSLDYDLDINNLPEDELTKYRSFIAMKPADLKVVVRSISGNNIIPKGTFINISIPPIWKIDSVVDKGSCENVIFHNYNPLTPYPTISCELGEDLANGQTAYFTFKATSYIDSMFLLPSIAYDFQSLNESYVPGLFVLVKRPTNVTKVPHPHPNPQPRPVPKPKPVPKPVPQPVPKPRPKPKIRIVLIPLKTNYTVYQGQMIPTYFKVKNIGNVTAYNITLLPVLPSKKWKTSKSFVDVLKPHSSVKRTIMIRPGINTPPGLYVIPVRAMIGKDVVALAYISVHVLYGKWYAKLKIVEAPQELDIIEGNNMSVPILLKNIGHRTLHNVTLRFENVENCLSFQKSGNYVLKVNETKSARILIGAENKPAKCKAILIVSSKEQAYAFAFVNIVVLPHPPLLPLNWKYAPWFSLLWTMILMIYTVIRKRAIKHGYARRSKVARIIVYTLLFGELGIIIYAILWVFGYVASLF